jgi:2Fe-2S ferredoxin
MNAYQDTTIIFQPIDRQVVARPGDTLLDAALDNGVDLPHECGGNCTCTSCHVVIHAGSANLSAIEEPETYRLQFAADNVASSRLACQALVKTGPVIVEIRRG